LLLLVYLFVAYIVAARGWLNGVTQSLQAVLERVVMRWAGALTFLQFLAPQAAEQRVAVASRDEFAHLVQSNTHAFTESDKLRVLAAMQFGSLKISDAMVPRDKIATVDVGETVGPVLLDRLHKDGHKIFAAVKKDLDHMQGWVYMSDLTSGHPDLKKVKDAVRATVHHVPAGAPLAEVFAASLQSGRQLFIVSDENGNISGLISLRDALAKLLGSAPPNHTLLLNDHKKAKK
jgi:CBS domain containing-hemolysin-like protein